ncbi:DUF4127 family protein [Paenibacillus sp.]|uniref:DUF4127 family protein n=1 Tax=Paenibacillus sp. TaxID=58172 RepID=UPI002811CDF8|nr:DUF4127 family protein [Paenibacillus sp.]
MESIVYLPLDERPCNYYFPLLLSKATAMPMSPPPLNVLGRKKHPANGERIVQWLVASSANAKRAVVSLDMLIYGGIVPSRLHYQSLEDCTGRIEVLRQIKRHNPGLAIYAFNLIMRVPAYDGADEEPDYYAQYGRMIHLYGWYQDKKSSLGLSAEEEQAWEQIRRELPEDILADFTGRRAINASMNKAAIRLVQEGIIHMLIIPLDDNAEYGFSAMEQRELIQYAEMLDVADKVHIYPGADEIGCTLYARVLCDAFQFTPSFFVRYSSTEGPFVIPRYEDRSLNESIKAHLTASGSFMSESAVDSDVVLMVNAPPIGAKQAAESGTAFSERHRSYFSETNPKELIQAIERYVQEDRLVALADVAVSNGADHPFMKMLARAGLHRRICAYGAWNTSGNTLGTVIAHGVIHAYYRQAGIEMNAEQRRASDSFLLLRLLEDWGYQTLLRREVTHELLPTLNADYFDIAHVEEQVVALLHDKLRQFADQYLRLHEPDDFTIRRVYSPWSRMFEVGIDLEWNRN